jgi:glycerophosphoryl diester phosphodiesterase
VPRLEDAIAVIGELGLGANVELTAARGRAAETGARAADLVARAWADGLGELLISSFDLDALAAARDRAPHIPRGVLFRGIPRDWRSLAGQLGSSTIHADHRRLRPALVAEICRAGYPLLAYTVNDPQRARSLFDWGVTSVFSDVPQRLHGAAARGGGGQPIAAERVSAAIARQGSVW